MNFRKSFISIIIILLVISFGCSKKEKNSTEKIQTQINNSIKKISDTKENLIKKVENVNKQAQKLIDSKKDILQNNSIKENKEKLWQIYKDTKKNIREAKLQERFPDLINLLKQQVKTTEKLGRKDIEAWQLNNIGYYSIEEFKKRINYDETMAKIYSTKDKKKKKIIYKNMIENMKKNFSLLKNSYPYLTKAKTLSENNNNQKQKKIIANNIAFINDIKKMIKKAEKK